MIVTSDDVADYKSVFNITTSDSDKKIELCLDSAFNTAERLTGLKMKTGAGFDAMPSKYDAVYIPRCIPVQAIDYIRINNITIPAITDWVSQGYYQEGNLIKFKGYSLFVGDFVEIKYTCGFQEIPSDLLFAIYKLCAFEISMPKRIGQKQVTGISKETTTYQEEIPADILQTFLRYRVLSL